jgi:hypothetical protein
MVVASYLCARTPLCNHERAALSFDGFAPFAQAWMTRLTAREPRAIESRVARRLAGESVQHDATQDRGDFIGGRIAPNDVESDVQHRLAEPVCEDRKIDVGSDVPSACSAQRGEYRA